MYHLLYSSSCNLALVKMPSGRVSVLTYTVLHHMSNTKHVPLIRMWPKVEDVSNPRKRYGSSFLWVLSLFSFYEELCKSV